MDVFDLLLVSHFTIIIALCYYYLYNKSNNIKTSQKTPEYIKEYLFSLGSDDFGDEIIINFGNIGHPISTFLSDDDIRNISAINIHRYLLKLISTDSDYLMFKMDLPDTLVFNITKKKSDKNKMAEFVIKVKSFCVSKEKEEGKKQVVEFGDIFSTLMPKMMASVIQEDTPNKEDNRNIEQLSREMNMILDD